MSETTTPTITAIIPTYQRSRLLKRAILSVLEQTYTDLQVCVYDNASADDTASVVAAIAARDSRVKYHRHPQNIGAYGNFQFGLEHVGTPFFSFLSDDDVLLPSFYEIAMRGFTQHPDAMLSATDVVIANEKGDVLKYTLASHRHGYYAAPDGLAEVFRSGNPTWTGILFRREVTDIVGMLDALVGAPADLDFVYRIAAKCPLVLSARPGAIFIDSGRGRYYFQPKTGLRKMIANLEDCGISTDLLRVVQRTLTHRYQRSNLLRCLYYLKTRDGGKALALAREMNQSPGRNMAYGVLAGLLRSRWCRSALGCGVRVLRGVQATPGRNDGTEPLAASLNCPPNYLECDCLAISARLEEQREAENDRIILKWEPDA